MKNTQKKEPGPAGATAQNKTHNHHFDDGYKLQNNSNKDNINRQGTRSENDQDEQEASTFFYIEPGTDLNDSFKPDKIYDTKDFCSYAPENKVIYLPTMDLWPPVALDLRLPPVDDEVNGRIKQIKPSEWLSKHRSIEQVFWYPGKPRINEGKLYNDGVLIDKPGIDSLNFYDPPTIKPGDSSKAMPWVNHVENIYEEDAGHLINWLAHRVQYPGEKVNHAIVLVGAPGIGKDTLLEPVKHAVGHRNFSEVTPTQLTGKFNGFVKSVILRVSEARDMGMKDRYGFYEHTKIYIAAPPNTFLCNEKNRKEYQVVNVTGLIITTNYKTGGIYLPKDDRRHYVACSDKTKDDIKEEELSNLWRFYENGGYEHVTAFLLERDLSDFDPKAPPPKTPAFYDIVDSDMAPEDADMRDALEILGNPLAVTKSMLSDVGSPVFRSWLTERAHQRQMPHRFESIGYKRHRNEGSVDGMWRISGKRENVYVQKHLTLAEANSAVDSLKFRQQIRNF